MITLKSKTLLKHLKSYFLIATFLLAWTLTTGCGRTQFDANSSNLLKGGSTNNSHNSPSELTAKEREKAMLMEELVKIENQLRVLSFTGIVQNGVYKDKEIFQIDLAKRLLIFSVPFASAKYMQPFEISPPQLKGVTISNFLNDPTTIDDQIHIKIPLAAAMRGVSNWPMHATQIQSKLLGGLQWLQMPGQTTTLFESNDLQISFQNSSFILSLALPTQHIFGLTLPLIEKQTLLRFGSIGLIEGEDGNSVFLIKVDLPEPLKILLKEWSNTIERLDSL